MSNTVVINSPRFGTLEISPERIIEFPAGLPGFDDLRQFTLFHPEGEDPKYFLLQSLDQPDLVFSIADPSRFGFTYEISLSDEETDLIGTSDPAEMIVAVFLLKEDFAAEPLRANLQAPLVINLKTRKGLQHVFSRLDYQVTLKGGN